MAPDSWQTMRQHLFSPNNFSKDAIIHFVAPGIVASGSEHISKFCQAISPSFLCAGSVLFNSKSYDAVETLRVYETAEFVFEEFIYTFLHSSGMDFILPGVLPTKKLLKAAVALSINLDENGLITTLRAYWDQAILIKQIGLLDNLPLCQPAAIEYALQHLPISSDSAFNLFVSPKSNFHSFIPFSEAPPPAARFGIADILAGKDEAIPAPASSASSHKISRIFDESDLVPSMQSLSIGGKPHKNASSDIFGTKDPILPAPPIRTLKPSRDIFGEEPELVKPSITVFPQRHASDIFSAAEPAPVNPALLLSYQRRNGTTEASEAGHKFASKPLHQHNKSSFDILSPTTPDSAPETKASASHHNISSFNLFSPEEAEEIDAAHPEVTSKRFETSFTGSGFSLKEEIIATDNKKHWPNHNSSSFALGESTISSSDQEQYRPRSNRNQSQIAFGDADECRQSVPSTR